MSAGCLAGREPALESTPVTDCMQLGRPKRVNWPKSAGRKDLLYREEEELLAVTGEERRGEARRVEERGKRRDLAACLIGDARRRGSCFRDLFVRDN